MLLSYILQKTPQQKTYSFVDQLPHDVELLSLLSLKFVLQTVKRSQLKRRF
jgi:hypothetical protein